MSLAFVFPGQGSQSPGMLVGLAADFSVVEDTFSQASDVLGYDLWKLVQEGPEDELNQTDKTQPALLAAGIAVWRVWEREHGPRPSVLAGHSLGEYTALVCANVFTFEDAISLVADRGRYMQESVSADEGAMAAILGLDDETVISDCARAAENEVVEAVNFNSPGQIVIAGNRKAVSRASDLAKQSGAKKVILLPVSVPSHCQLMRPAAERLRQRLSLVNFSIPDIPVIQNADVSDSSEPDVIRDGLVRQLYNPVRWVETINKMADRGVDDLIECGPGKVLTGLNKRINKKMKAMPVFDTTSLQNTLTQLNT